MTVSNSFRVNVEVELGLGLLQLLLCVINHHIIEIMVWYIHESFIYFHMLFSMIYKETIKKRGRNLPYLDMGTDFNPHILD